MDGEQLLEEVWQVDTRRENLTLVLGFSEFWEWPGMTTDLYFLICSASKTDEVADNNRREDMWT